MSIPSINFLHLTFSEIQPGQTFPPHEHLPAHPDTMDENNTPTALKGCGVKMPESPEMLYALSSPVTEATDGGLKV